MITVWIAVGIGVILAGLIILMCKLENNWEGFFEGIFGLGVMITVITFAITTMQSDTYLTNASADEVYVVDRHVTKLRALETGNELRGPYFLGARYIDEDPVYTYLEESEDGGFTMRTMSVGSARIYETNDREPSIVTEFIRAKDNRWSIHSKRLETKVYVPVGSVQAPEYRIDVDRGEKD